MKTFLLIFFSLLFTLPSYAQFNFWQQMIGNSCRKTRATCYDHFLAGCKEDRAYKVTSAASGSALCNMTTNGGGWQKKDTPSVDITKIKTHRQYIKYLSTISTNPIPNTIPTNTELSGIMKNLDQTNYMVAKGVTTFPKTLNGSTTNGTYTYNYIGGHKWFMNNGFSEITTNEGSQNRSILPPFDFLVFGNGSVVLITWITNGYVPTGESAYSYFYTINYEVWERP